MSYVESSVCGMGKRDYGEEGGCCSNEREEGRHETRDMRQEMVGERVPPKYGTASTTTMHRDPSRASNPPPSVSPVETRRVDLESVSSCKYESKCCCRV